ncbi:MAG: MMPL family transporter [Pirellulaceae bacterium]
MTEWLVAWRWPLLAVALALTCAAFWSAQRLDFDRSIENMFAEGDPLIPPYQKLKRTFGGNEVVLVVYQDDQLMTAEGLERLERVTDELASVAGVRGVLSLAKINEVLAKTENLGKLPQLPNFFNLGGKQQEKQQPTPPILSQDNAMAERFRQLFQGYTHNAQGDIAAIACMLIPERETAASRRDTIDALRRIADSQHGMIAGEPVMVVDGFRYVEEDGARLGWWSTILLSLTIIACFRSVRWVLIPILVVQLTLLLTRAILVASGLQLSMVSSMLTAIVTVVGVATVVHIIVRFREARLAGWSPRGALVQAGGLLMWPIVGACLTDAVGFASLLVAQVGPVQDFGVMMAIGSLVVLLSVALLVPGLALLGRFDADPQSAWGEAYLSHELQRLIGWVEGAPKTLGLLVVVLVAGAVAGVARLEVETDFTNNFLPSSPIVQSYRYIEENLGGGGVWDVMVPAPRVLDNDYLARVRKLEERLRAIRLGDDNDDNTDDSGAGVLTKVISLADADLAAQASPILAAMPPEIRAQGMAQYMQDFAAALRSAEPDADGNYYMRIMLRARERQPAEQKERLIQQVRRIVGEEFPGDENEPAGEVTGFFVLLTNLIHSMVRDQWVTFGVAAAGIGLMMMIAFRSLTLALVALVPNALPILIVLGGMGWLDLKINMGAAMIAAVSMGLSVDSSIHYITSFRRARRAGKTVSQSLSEVQQTVGRAMVFSTLALIVGFTVLCTSQFVPTIYFGTLVSLSMLGGLLGNLLVLPLLLQLVIRDKPMPASAIV